MGTPHSLKHQGWSLTIRLFNVISRTLEVLSVNSPVIADWAEGILAVNINLFKKEALHFLVYSLPTKMTSKVLVGLGFMAYQPLQVIQCQIIYIYIYIYLFVNAYFVDNIFKLTRANLFAHSYKWAIEFSSCSANLTKNGFIYQKQIIIAHQ